jgi:Na+/phosphate symporter
MEKDWRQMMERRDETLIERFKRYYQDYRASADADTSFDNALQALTLSVIDQAGDLAERNDADAIRSMVREYHEIRLSVQGSNDSVKERFERELQERAKQGVH